MDTASKIGIDAAKTASKSIQGKLLFRKDKNRYIT